MRREVFFILFVTLSLCFLVGCSQETGVSGMGQIDLSIDTESMNNPEDVVAYNVVIENTDGVAMLDHSGSTKSQYSISVPAGNYTASVEALDGSGHVIGKGSVSAAVSGGQINTFAVPVTEISGKGPVFISVACNASGTLSFSVSDDSRAEVGKGELGYSDGFYSSSVELQNGHYSLAI